MANKSDITIDINYTFYGLHDAAIKEANKLGNDLYVANTAIDEKNKTFVGTGEFNLISMPKTDDNGAYATDKYTVTENELSALSGDALDRTIKDKSELLKSESVNSLKTYVRFFCGENYEDSIKEDKLQPLLVPKNIPHTTTSEAIHLIDARKPLIENLFCKMPEIVSEASDNLDTVTVNPTYGYMTDYNVEFNGKFKEGSRADFFKKWTKTAGSAVLIAIKPFISALSKIFKMAFGNTLDDLKSFSIKTGGMGNFNVGNAVAGVAGAAKDAIAGTAKNIAGAAKALNLNSTIDANTAPDKLQQQILSIDQFKHANVRCELWKTKQLITHLFQQKKITTKLLSYLKKDRGFIYRMLFQGFTDANWQSSVQYLIAVLISKDSHGYDDLTEERLAKIATKAFGRSGKFSIKPEQIFKIEDYESTEKYKQDYEGKRKITLENVQNKIMSLIFEDCITEASNTELYSQILKMLNDNKKDIKDICIELVNSKYLSDKDVRIGATHSSPPIRNKREFSYGLKNASDFDQFLKIYKTSNPKLQAIHNAIEDAIDTIKSKRNSDKSDSNEKNFNGRMFIIVSKYVKDPKEKQSLLNKDKNNQKETK